MMKSAYVLLGVSANASQEEVEAAFQRASSRNAAKTVDTHSAENFADIKNAYQVLRDRESREAHDRKLAGGSTRQSVRQVRIVEREPAHSSLLRPLPILVFLVLAVFASGFYMHAKRENARKEEAARELQLQKLAAQEEEKQTAIKAQDAADKLQRERVAVQQEKQFRVESNRAFANAQSAEARRSNEDAQRQNAEERANQQKEYQARMREQDNVRQAQQRIALDKARIRELCYINYRRYDC